jgi:hypothetical protein
MSLHQSVAKNLCQDDEVDEVITCCHYLDNALTSDKI